MVFSSSSSLQILYGLQYQWVAPQNSSMDHIYFSSAFPTVTIVPETLLYLRQQEGHYAQYQCHHYSTAKFIACIFCCCTLHSKFVKNTYMGTFHIECHFLFYLGIARRRDKCVGPVSSSSRQQGRRCWTQFRKNAMTVFSLF